MQTFGKLLKGFRRRKGLSQETLSDTLGVHRNSISDWERNSYLPRTRQMVLDLSEALGIDKANTDQLLRAADYPLEYNTHGGMDALLSDINIEFTTQAQPDEVEKSVFVAREDELVQLNQLLTNVLAKRQGCVAFVNGEAGSGKTALVQEFSRCAMQTHSNLVVVGGNCNAFVGVGDPYLPFREILGLLTYNMETRWASDTFMKEFAPRLCSLMPYTIQALLQSGKDLIDTFLSGPALLASAASCADGASWFSQLKSLVTRKTADQLPNTPHRKNLFEQYTRVLRLLSRNNPLVLVLEDLQWADNGSIGLLFHLGKQLKDCPLLILGLYRPADVALGRNNERHPLEPVINEFQLNFGHSPVELEKAKAKEFLKSFLDTVPNKLSMEFQEALFQHTCGNALFTIETIHTMQRNGGMHKIDSGHWVEGPSLDWQTLPARIDGIIRERIDRLPPNLKETLKVACVEGEVFHAEVIAQVHKVDAWTITRQLSDVLDKQHHLVTSKASRRLGSQRLSHYRFKHNLFQRYLYNSLDKVEKAFLHELVGNALEFLYSDRIEAIAGQLARHFKETQLNNKAVGYLIQAGKLALQLSATDDAITHFNEAQTLLQNCPDTPERTEQELNLLISLGLAQIAIKGNAAPEVEQTYIRARELCQRTDSASKIVHVLAGLWGCYFSRGELNKAREVALELLELTRTEQNPLVYMNAHGTLGATLCAMGEFPAALEHCNEGTSIYRTQQNPNRDYLICSKNPEVIYPAYAAIALWALGFPDQANNRSRESIALAKEVNQHFSLTFAHGMSAFLHLLRREEEIVEKRVSSTLEFATKYGLGQWNLLGNIFRSWELTQQGKADAEINTMKQAVDGWLATGVNLASPYFLVILAEAYATSGQTDTGLATLDQAIIASRNSEERWFEAEIHRVKGDLLRKLGSAEAEIEAMYRKSLDVAVKQQAKSWELRTVMSISRLRLSQGRQSEAVPLLIEIYDWFNEGFDTQDLLDAKSLLEKMT